MATSDLLPREDLLALLETWGEYSSQRVPVSGSKAGLVYTTGETIVEQRLDDDTDHFKGVDEQTRCAPAPTSSSPAR